MELEVQKAISFFTEKTGARLVFLAKTGSKLYGTNNEKSDTDYKGVFIPSKESILLKQDISSYVSNTSEEKNSSTDIDISLGSIYSFFSQLSKSETGATDLLFSMFSEENVIFEDKEFTKLIKDNYRVFLNKNMKSFIGYALGQTKKFGIKGARYEELDSFVQLFDSFAPELLTKDSKLEALFEGFREEIEERDYKYIKFQMAPGPRGSGTYNDVLYISVLGKMFEGNVSIPYFIERVMKIYKQFGHRTISTAQTESKTDFKALSHALRVALETEELLKTEFIQFPLKEGDYLREVKEGKYKTSDVIDRIQDTLDNVDKLLLVSELPEEVQQSEVDKLLLNLIK